MARESTVPYANLDTGQRGTAKVVWDIVVTKLSGLARWRFIVPIDHVVLSDGRFVPGTRINVFVLLKFASFHSLFDARQGLISSDPMRASQVEAEAERVEEQFSGTISVFFKAFTTDKTPKGAQRQNLVIDPTNPTRAIALPDVKDP